RTDLPARLQQLCQVIRVGELGQGLLDFAIALKIEGNCRWPSAPRDDDVLPVGLQIVEQAVQARDRFSTYGVTALPFAHGSYPFARSSPSLVSFQCSVLAPAPRQRPVVPLYE